jgi:hypothetical protein
MYSPEENALISMYRAKAANGSLTQEDIKQVVVILRQGRRSAVGDAAKRRAAAKQTRTADELFNELEAL